MDWTPLDFRRRRRRRHLRVSWTTTVKKDLELLGVTREEELDLTLKDRSEWRNCTARCAPACSRRKE